MTQQELHAIDAIWKTELETSHEKLVLYHLATRHELGDRYASNWKSVERFIEDFQKRWSSTKDLRHATQLSEVKLQRTIDGLLKKGYIERQEVQETSASGVHIAHSYAITPKIFTDFVARQIPQKKAKGA